MPYRQATIRDVARQAGVSVGTVSNVFNGKGRLGEETRRRVLQAAQEMHFTPNALVRSLQRGRTNTIGVLWFRTEPAPARCVSLPLLRGLLNGIHARGYDLLLYSNTEDRFGDPWAFLDGRVDALIWTPVAPSAEGLSAVAAAGLPTVAIWYHPVPENVGAVTVASYDGAAMAVDHLVSLGHRRIAFDGNLRSPMQSDRAQGFRDTLLRHGIAADPALFLAGERDFVPFEEAVVHLMDAPSPPTAIFAGTDDRALSWLEALTERGLRVPRDVSVVGFDDAPAAAAAGLTTVRQPCEELGRLAARLLDDLARGRPANECRVELPVDLIVRGSTAPPAGVGRRGTIGSIGPERLRLGDAGPPAVHASLPPRRITCAEEVSP